MKPSQLARSLKRIASGIENSKNPKRDLVIRDLRNVILAMNSEVTDIINALNDSNYEWAWSYAKEIEQKKLTKIEAIAFLYDSVHEGAWEIAAKYA